MTLHNHRKISGYYSHDVMPFFAQLADTDRLGVHIEQPGDLLIVCGQDIVIPGRSVHLIVNN